MSTDVRVEARIGRPRDEVAAHATDPRHDPEWIGGIREARLLGEPPVRVGSQVERVARFLGRRIEYVNEVVELAPARRLVMRSVKAPFPMRVTYEFADAGGGATTMAIRVQGDAGRFYRLAGPLLARMVRRNVSGDLERLRRSLEGRDGD